MPSFDNNQAVAEGWVMGDRSGDDPPYAIQTLDTPEEHEGNTGRTFASDDDAAAYVVACAEAGSLYHADALRFLGDHSPEGLKWANLAYLLVQSPRVRVPAGSRPHG